MTQEKNPLSKFISKLHAEKNKNKSNIINSFFQLTNQEITQLSDREKNEVILLLTDEEISKLSDKKQALVSRSFLYTETKRYNEALEDLNNTIKLYPDYANAYAYRGDARYYLGQYGESIKDYNKALDLDYSKYNIYNALGHSKLAIEQYEEAIIDFNKAIEKDNKENTREARAYSGLGMCYFNLHKYNEAIEYFNKSLKYNDPVLNESYIKYCIGVCYIIIGKTKEAIKYFISSFKILNEKSELNSQQLTQKADTYLRLSICYTKIIRYDCAITNLKEQLNMIETTLYNHNKYMKEVLLKNPYLFSSIPKLNLDIGNLKSRLVHTNNLIADNYFYKGNKEAIEYYKKSTEIANEIIDNNLYNVYEITINGIKILKEKNQKRIQEINNISKFNKIYNLIQNIKGLAKYNGEYITHYTKTTTAHALLNYGKDEAVNFQLSHVSIMNDPTEGEVLFDILGNRYENNATFKNDFFVASFSENDDALTLWRTYGKDNHKEATGVNITYKAEEFKNALLYPKIKVTDTAYIGLYSIIYYDAKKKSYILSSNTNSGGTLKKQFNKLKKALLKIKIDILDQEEKDFIYDSLSELRYLVKSSDYYDEKEVRIIYFTPEPEKKIMITDGKPKVYVETKAPVPIKKIKIAPNVPDKHIWEQVFKIALKERHNVDNKWGNDDDVTISDCKIRNS